MTRKKKKQNQKKSMRAIWNFQNGIYRQDCSWQ